MDGLDQASGVATEPPARGPGRPRSVEADRAILDAALEELATHGFDGLTVDAVAARAGVSKATIYRRYPGKTDLVIAAATKLTAPAVSVPDTGSIRTDLTTMLGNFRQLMTGTTAGRVARMMIAELQRNPEVAATYREFITARRAGTIAVVRRAIRRGELREDTDVELLADLVVAPLFYRLFISGRPTGDVFLDAVVDAAVLPFWRVNAARARRSGTPGRGPAGH